MGQYHIPVNIDKREYIYAHKFGNGLKMLEWGTGGGTVAGLTVLLACSHDRGGGDLRGDVGDIGGRWAGDRIVILGDYTEKGDPGTAPLYRIAGSYDISLYSYVVDNFTDISRDVIAVLCNDHYLAADFEENVFYQRMLDEEESSAR